MTGTEPASARPTRRLRLSLTTQILIGLALGTLLGLFFGEPIRVLQPLADAYIRLMQMTVLPYLSVGLILGIGRLDLAHARLLARYGIITLLTLWLCAIAVVCLMPLAFPHYDAALFFSTTLLQEPEPLSFVDLYIPANPFNSLANSVVPAVTLFSAAVGIALIGLPGKERFLAPFSVFMDAIARITRFIVRLTPIGVVPIAAVAAGTLSFDELSRLEVYLVTFIAGALVLGLVILPLLVRSLTPFGYREVIGSCRDALLTAFVTNNVFIVLPMVAEASDELARRHGVSQNAAASVGEVVVPIAFNFPTAGKLLTLLFVPFAAWLAGDSLAATRYPGLLLAGVSSYFAKAQVALPFLLDLVEVPHDLFQLYIPTTLINGKFDSMVGAMSLFAFALITMTAMAGRLRIEVGGLLRFGLVSALSLVVTVVAVGAVLARVVDTTDTKSEALRNLNLSRSIPPYRIYDDQPPPVDEAGLELDSLQRVLARRSLRVGYFEDHVPFSFRNARGELVGYDIEMAAQLALDLGVALELVAVEFGDMEALLKSGQVDVVAGVRYTHHWIKRLRMSEPYTDVTIGLLVKDSRRDEFATLADIRAHPRLTFGVGGDRDLGEDYVKAFAGDVPYWIVPLNSMQEVLNPPGERPIDATVVLAESGMAWSLLHPEFSVVIPRNALLRRSLAFGMEEGADHLGEFVDEWVRLQEVRGNTKRAYDYWILGKGTEKREPRWSIIRNVLHWQ